MVKNFLVFLTILLVNFLSNFNFCASLRASLNKEMGTIIFANVLFRHGDRTPINPYPNDPYKNASYWPVEFGQLTNTGKEQQYELGKWLRTRYASLLTHEYRKELIYVQSTDVDRTLMSAASNLAGMYPPAADQRWNPKLDWQPIPIHTIPENIDKVLAAKHPCPAYQKEYKRVLNSQEIQNLNKRFSNIFKILNENTGREVNNLDDVEYIYNTLFIENLYNFTLPAWTKDIFPQPLEDASKYSFALPTWNLKLARLKTGLLVQHMIKNMRNKKDNVFEEDDNSIGLNRDDNKPKVPPNLWIYSAHDSTIASLLNTLGVFDLQNPPYISAVLMELREDSVGNHGVTVFFRNSSSHEPYLLTLPGCTPLCPLDKFISLCQPVIPTDWDAECRAGLLFSTSYNAFTIIALFTSSLLILLLIISVGLYWQRGNRHTHCSVYARMSLVAWDRYNNVKSQKQELQSVTGY